MITICLFCFVEPEENLRVPPALQRGSACRGRGDEKTAPQCRASPGVTVARQRPDGVNEGLVVRGRGFTRRMLTSLVRAGLAAAERKVMVAGGKMIAVVRIRITAAGRSAIGGDAGR